MTAEFDPLDLATSDARLLRLADYLETVPSERFNYSKWLGDDFSALYAKDPNTCGTQACALGHATMVPEFRALGLHAEPADLRHVFSGLQNSGGLIRYKDAIEIDDVIEDFFGIGYDESKEAQLNGVHPFYPEEVYDEDEEDYTYNDQLTPKEVALRIRNFVATRGEA